MHPWSRMKVSASLSSSRVVIPGRIVRARWLRQAARMRPEVCIFSISSGFFSRNVGSALMSGPSAARSFDEALVLAHQELGLDLLHGVEGDADDDEDGGAAEVEARGRRGAGDDARAQRQHHGDDGEEQG